LTRGYLAEYIGIYTIIGGCVAVGCGDEDGFSSAPWQHEPNRENRKVALPSVAPLFRFFFCVREVAMKMRKTKALSFRPEDFERLAGLRAQLGWSDSEIIRVLLASAVVEGKVSLRAQWSSAVLEDPADVHA
jgi:hypothetical protein